jgi:DNA invertase Pin-like site-specific DNA recombinase
MFAALARFERELVRERTLAGLAAARARGRKGGRPRPLSTSQQRIALSMMNNREMSVAAIAEHLGVSRSTLYNLQKSRSQVVSRD